MSCPSETVGSDKFIVIIERKNKTERNKRNENITS